MSQLVSTPVFSSAMPRRGASNLQDLTHELRQPLSVIENLAYYLELRSQDEAAIVQLRKIQAMVLQAHAILSKAAD